MLNEIKKELGIYNTYMLVFYIKKNNNVLMTNAFTTATSLTQSVIKNASDDVQRELNAEEICCINVVRLDD